MRFPSPGTVQKQSNSSQHVTSWVSSPTQERGKRPDLPARVLTPFAMPSMKKLHVFQDVKQALALCIAEMKNTAK